MPLTQNVNKLISPIIITILIIIIYSNNLQGDWQFDDTNNIKTNTNIHLTSLDFQSIKTTFFHWKGSQKVSRPVAYFTFAINWLISKDNVISYHLVNNTIHIITSILLYLVIFNLLTLPKTKDLYKTNAQYIALLATVLWAVNPIQTQAITYLVQRMTSLAAMFSILSIYLYLLGRNRCINHVGKKCALFFFSFLSFLLAVGAKENSILLPGSIILIELIFFHSIALSYFTQKPFIRIIFPLLAFIIVFSGILLLLDTNFFKIFATYEKRYFTLEQRLLTEPRILLFYLSLIFYPISNRLSVEHDFTLSTSLLTPWTTFPSILLILLSIVFAILKFKKFPLLCLAILFFFYNHIVESTIIPLELVFEHRNYLPSFFLFCPLVSAVLVLQNHIRKQSFNSLLNISLVLIVIFFSIGTYSRNFTWLTKESLLLDAIEKAPGKARPYHNLSVLRYLRDHKYEESLRLNQISLDKTEELVDYIQLRAFDNMISIHVKVHNDFEKAIELIKRKLSLFPTNPFSHEQLAVALVMTGRLDEAFRTSKTILDILSKPLSGKPKRSKQYYLNLHALLLIKLEKLPEALPFILQAIEINPDDEFTLANLGYYLMKTGRHRSANHYLQASINHQKNKELAVYLLLIENSLYSNNKDKADEYIDIIISTYTVNKIFTTLTKLRGKNHLSLPVNATFLLPIIRKKIESFVKEKESTEY